MARRVVDLAGSEWRLAAAPVRANPAHAELRELDGISDWLPSRVPGNIQDDLARAGRMPDPLFGTHAEDYGWVDGRCWWLQREFPLQAFPSERVYLVLRGVDYISDLFLNGHHLGRHEGMFSPRTCEITGLLQPSNRLALRITGSRWLPTDRSTAWEKLLNHIEARFDGLPRHHPHRRDTVKCQMGFGWDFAPPLRSMGIWDDVQALVTGTVFVRDILVRTRFRPGGTSLEVTIELDARQAGTVQLCCILRGETFGGEDQAIAVGVNLPDGVSRHTLEATVREPHLWWPWELGQPDLYRLTVEVWDGPQLLDSSSLSLGLRQVELEGHTLRVNGRRLFARGANWVPADILPGRITTSDYYALLSLAREANMNMLRVWGGGLREKAAFYELCSRLGILVWQEFPFAGAFLTRYPRSPAYLHLVDSEVRAIIRDLRNHPCVVLWCGGNELKPERNAPLVQTLRAAVAQEDPTRPFLPASPHGRDHHNWRVWHGSFPPAAYRDDLASFASELGLQAPPDAATLRRFIPDSELWPPGRSWAFHGAGLGKLRRYARPFLHGGDGSLNGFVQASQRAQAHGLQIAIEHFRRRKALGCGGVLVWQLNEPWPAITWALVDYYHQPKAAYRTVKRLFRPLLVSADYPLRKYQAGDPFSADLWVINDATEDLPGCKLEAELLDGAGMLASRLIETLDIPAGSAEIVRRLTWRIPSGTDWRFTCRLESGGLVLSDNEYDLAVCDDLAPTLPQRLRAWLASLMLSR